MKSILRSGAPWTRRVLSSHQTFARKFGAKAHAFPEELPYYPYAKPSEDLDADDWDSREFELSERPTIPAWGEEAEGWKSVGPDPKTINKKFYDIFAPKEKYIYTRTKPYALKKTYTQARLTELVDNSAWLIVLQHNFSSDEFSEFSNTLNKESKGRIKMKMCIKNSLAKRVLAEGPYSALADLFSGPTVVAYANEFELEDIHTLIKSSPPDKILLLGAKIQDGVATYAQIRDLQKVKSLDTLAFDLIATIQQPLRTLVQVLKSPQDNLVKTIDFQAKKLTGPEEETEGDAAAPVAEAAN